MSDETESAKIWRDSLAEKYQSDEAKIAAFEASHQDMDLRRVETRLGYYEDGLTDLAFSDFVAGWEEAIYAAGLGPKPYRSKP